MSVQGMRWGVQSLEDLRQRCVVDEVSRCWLYPWSGASNSPCVWMPALGKTLSVGAAVYLLRHGQPLPKGRQYVAMCKQRNCCNPQHRRAGTMALVQQLHRPTLTAAHRAAILASRVKHRHAAYSPQLRAEILGSSETCAEIGRRYGLHASLVSRIRRGEAWADAVPTASPFHLGAAA